MLAIVKNCIITVHVICERVVSSGCNGCWDISAGNILTGMDLACKMILSIAREDRRCDVDENLVMLLVGW